MDIMQVIAAAVKKIGEEQQRRLTPVADDLPLLNSGLDSLGFALLVAKLEDDLGVDPFTDSEIDQPPITFGDFAKLYEQALRKAA